MFNFLYTIILYPLEQIIEISFSFINKLFNHNIGIAILGVSLTVTLLCLPLYIVAESWQEKERKIQRNMKDGIDRIKKYFKGDEQYMILNTYYRQNHYHPIMALRSSFGLLIQIPFFLAAYHCLSHLPALQGRSFLFIKDMGKPDSIFSIGSFSINILPIAMTLINCISGAIYSKDHGIREKIQIYGMAAIFLIVLYNSPAGLVLYWTMNNVFSLLKNIFYKIKKPLFVLYILSVIFIIFIDIFILIFYDGRASMSKRLLTSIGLSLLIFTPFYIRIIQNLLQTYFLPLVQNKKIRHLLFITSAIATAILTGLLLPSQIIQSSVQEFSDIETFTNPNQFLIYSFFQALGLFVFWPCCTYFLFREKIQTLITLIFSTGIIAGIINAFLFNGNYGSMDISLTFINGFKNQTLLFMSANLILCIIIFATIVLLVKINKIKYIYTISQITILISILFTGINMHKISTEYNAYEIQKSNKTTSSNNPPPQFHLSKTKKNVIVLMLDRLGSVYIDPIFNDRPSLLDDFTGFTYYKNTCSFDTHTLMGSPLVYGGYEYQPLEMNKKDDIKLKDKHNQALLLLPRIFTEQADDFTATCSDLSWGNYSYYSNMDFTKPYTKINGINLYKRYTIPFKKDFASILPEASLSKNIKRNLIWVSFFRISPVLFRPIVYYKGEWWSFYRPQDYDSFIDWYSELYYLPQITDFTNTHNSFCEITNETPHASNADISGLKLLGNQKFSYHASDYEVSMVSLDAVATWLRYLKENNCYDNTRIIIVADHGAYTKINSPLGKGKILPDGKDVTSFNPALLVKDFNESGKIKTSMKFMTNGDVPALALKDIKDDAINPFTGNTVNLNECEKEKANGIVVSNADMFMPYYSSSEYKFTISDNDLWVVKDNIFNAENWKPYKQQ